MVLSRPNAARRHPVRLDEVTQARRAVVPRDTLAGFEAGPESNNPSSYPHCARRTQAPRFSEARSVASGSPNRDPPGEIGSEQIYAMQICPVEVGAASDIVEISADRPASR
jgi:hypothetical protein